MTLSAGVRNQAVVAEGTMAAGRAQVADGAVAAESAVVPEDASAGEVATAAEVAVATEAAAVADTAAAVPFQFGTAARASAGSTRTPGAFSLTWIDVRSHEEAEEIRLTAAAVAAELAAEPGFISWMGLEIGSRLYTITAWENSDAVSAVMRNRTHQAVVRRFFTGNLGAAASTSVWRADRINALWTRCPACTTMTDRAQANGTCPCGEPLAAAPDPW